MQFKGPANACMASWQCTQCLPTDACARRSRQHQQSDQGQNSQQLCQGMMQFSTCCCDGFIFKLMSFLSQHRSWTVKPMDGHVVQFNNDHSRVVTFHRRWHQSSTCDLCFKFLAKQQSSSNHQSCSIVIWTRLDVSLHQQLFSVLNSP